MGVIMNSFLTSMEDGMMNSITTITKTHSLVIGLFPLKLMMILKMKTIFKQKMPKTKIL